MLRPNNSNDLLYKRSHCFTGSLITGRAPGARIGDCPSSVVLQVQVVIVINAAVQKEEDGIIRSTEQGLEMTADSRVYGRMSTFKPRVERHT